MPHGDSTVVNLKNRNTKYIYKICRENGERERERRRRKEKHKTFSSTLDPYLLFCVTEIRAFLEM
jgi:hypothetical protein